MGHSLSWGKLRNGAFVLVLCQMSAYPQCCEGEKSQTVQTNRLRTAESDPGIPQGPEDRERIKVRGLLYHPETIYQPGAGKQTDATLTVLISVTPGLVGRTVLVSVGEAENLCTRGCNAERSVELEYVGGFEKKVQILSSEHLVTVEFILRHPPGQAEGTVKHRAYINLLGSHKGVDHDVEQRTMRACEALTLK